MQISCTRIFISVSLTSLVCLLDAAKLARNQYVTNVPTSIYQTADNKGISDFLHKLFQQFDRLCQFKIHFSAFLKNENGCFFLSFLFFFFFFVLEATCEKESRPSGIQHPQQLS